MKRYSDPFTQGGQTELHHFHMLRQVIGTTLKLSFLMSLLFFMLLLCWSYSWEQFYFLAAYYKACFRTSFDFLPQGFFDTSWIPFANGLWQEVRDNVIANNSHYINLASSIKIGIFKKSLYGLIFFYLNLIAMSVYWVSRGRGQQAIKVLKGYEIVSPEVLKKQVLKQATSKLTIANIPLPDRAECEHIMITGTTGSGKTNAIYALLKQIRALGHKAIIVDTHGGFMSRFYDRKKDLLLNPFDKRTQYWDLWQECLDEYDFDEFAESLIPLESYDKFWSRAAQQLFSTAALEMKKSNKHSIQTLLDVLLSKPLKEITEQFKNTVVSAYVDPSTEKMALGIRASLVSAIKNLKYLEKGKRPFSIRTWLKSNKSNWLFLSSLPTQRETLKPLMSAWLSIAVKSLMCLVEDLNRRVWFIIDELASLNRIPILMQALAESRRYGGCFVLSFQDLHQLDVIYGSHVAHTLSALTGTKLIFRLDSYAAKQMADLFGEQETLEANQSISFGAHQMREGVSLSDQKHFRVLLSPADLMKLDNFEAYLKFPRNLPVSKVKFELQDLNASVPAFKKKSPKTVQEQNKSLEIV